MVALKRLLETLFRRLAEFDLAAPLGLEHLGGGDTTGWIGVKDGVDDVAAASLMFD